MNPNPFWVLNHFTCARRRRRGESVTRIEEPPSNNPSVVVSRGNPRRDRPRRRQGSAREASEGAVRLAPRLERRTLPVSFVIVFRGGNCDGESGARAAMVPSAVDE